MTDSIQLPVHVTGNMMKPPYIVVTPELARQIVALGDDDKLCFHELEKRIESLEATCKQYLQKDAAPVHQLVGPALGAK
jgi:hypothetical protein